MRSPHLPAVPCNPAPGSASCVTVRGTAPRESSKPDQPEQACVPETQPSNACFPAYDTQPGIRRRCSCDRTLHAFQHQWQHCPDTTETKAVLLYISLLYCLHFSVTGRVGA